MARKVQLNKAGRDELASVPGIGPSTAEAVIKLRKERGGFKNVAELEEVSGIGPQTLQNLRAHVSVGGRAEPSPQPAGKAAEAPRRAADNGVKAATAAAETGTRVAEEAGDAQADAARRGAETAAAAGKASAGKAHEVGTALVDAARTAAAAQARTAETATRSASDALETVTAGAEEGAEAAATSIGGLFEAAHEVQQAWLGLLHDQMWANVHTAQQLARCRSPQEWLEVQADYVRSSMGRLLEEQAHLTQLGARSAACSLWPVAAVLRRG